MAPRKKRIKASLSDDSENSTFDSKGQSSGSDVPILERLKKLRHQGKKVNSEDYDGDCELEQNDKNRVKKTATRSRSVLKPKTTNTTNRSLSDCSSSTPVIHMDVDDCFGFENLTTPISYSPVRRFRLSTTPDTPTSPTSSVMTINSPIVMSPIAPRPIFESPVDKPKRTKRKRLPKKQQAKRQSSPPTKQEEEMIVQFLEVEKHELLIEPEAKCPNNRTKIRNIYK